MSRVIVKNLPGKVTEKGLRELFSECGEVTDIKLMKTRGGSFRRFGFVGFVSEAQAEATVEHFDKTFIKASRIAVEIAKPYGDKSLTRPWSKYSKGSSANQQWEKRRREKIKEVQSGKELSAKEKQREQQQGLGQNQHKSKLSKLLGEYCDLESDPQFQEFLSTHKHKSKVHTWADDTATNTSSERKAKVKPSLGSVESKRPGQKGILMSRTHLEFEEDKEESGSESESKGEGNSNAESEGEGGNPASTSDMEYLRTKIVHKEHSSGDPSDSGSSDDESAMSDVQVTEEQRDSIGTTPYTLKMRGLPFNATEEDIHAFFYPINVVSIRTTTDNRGRPSGRAYVDFASEADLKSALQRNKDCIGRRYIELFRDEGPQTGTRVKGEPENLKPWELKAAYFSGAEEKEEEEGIAESGRLFVRNLPFTTTEEDLSELFGKFGPLAEVTVPLDKNTNKPTGTGEADSSTVHNAGLK